jgi:hypothetical protein
MASLHQPPPDRLLPLAGVDELTPAHVMAMLRRRFFGHVSTRDHESHTRRLAALIAMHSLAGAGPSELERFETEHFDAEGRSVLLTLTETSRFVFVTPALLHVLTEWLEIRKSLVGPHADCRSMFVDDDGAPLHLKTISGWMHHIGVRLGAPRSLSTMLLDFFRATVARGLDPEAYRYVLGRFPNQVKNSSATLRDIRDLVAGTDRIGDDLGFLTEARAAEIARAANLPLSLDELSPGLLRALDPAHPLAIRLAAELEARPSGRDARADHDARVIVDSLSTRSL